MESASSSRTSLHSRKHKNRKASSSSFSTISDRISTAIKGKTCPICLCHIAGHRPAVVDPCMHSYCLRCLLRCSNYKRNCRLCNSHFDSYFSTSSLSSTTFHKHRLLPLHRYPEPPTARYTAPLPVQRVLRRTREEVSDRNMRSRPVAQRRSFGRLGSVPFDVILERVIQWRASIYRLGLQAVPFANRSLLKANMVTNTGYREAILQRIEPWIQRELQAVLQDPDPIVIVHVATSLYLSSIEKNPGLSSRCLDSKDDLLAPLRPFLHEWTDMFWHELRYFAESSFTVNTNDTVVEYRNSN